MRLQQRPAGVGVRTDPLPAGPALPGTPLLRGVGLRPANEGTHQRLALIHIAYLEWIPLIRPRAAGKLFFQINIL